MRAFWFTFIGGSSLGLLAYLVARPAALPISASAQPPAHDVSVETRPAAPRSKTKAPETEARSEPSPVTNSSSNTVLPAVSPTTKVNAAVPIADEPESPSAPLEQVRRLLVKYHTMFGENPVGTNEEITRALRGENTREINFLDGEVQPQNGKGELVDAWGTPLFFHQLSAKETEIRSAGPDKIMWTGDDLVTR